MRSMIAITCVCICSHYQLGMQMWSMIAMTCVFFIRLHILIICAQEVITFSIESLDIQIQCFPMPLSSDINNLLLVGHTHDDIDRFFSRLHVEIAGRDYYTVARIYNTKVGIMIQTLIMTSPNLLTPRTMVGRIMQRSSLLIQIINALWLMLSDRFVGFGFCSCKKADADRSACRLRFVSCSYRVLFA